jgi:hypothetical protein
MNRNVNDIFLEAVGKHFVTMSARQTPPGGDQAHVFVASGFVIFVEGFWFYVTAGHVIRDIQSAIAAGSTFDTWRLGDQAARSPFDSGIPYDFNADEWIVVRDERVGLDYAAFVLRELYWKGLRSGGIIPIGRETWGDHVTEYHQWMLIGVPAETVTYDGVTIIRAKLVSTPLKETDTPETAGDKVENQFYAKLVDGSEAVVKSVEGMSGGPIFATYKVENGLAYKVIGIQSAWYPTSRVVAACPFSSLGFGLEEAVRTLKERAATSAAT